MIRRPSPTSLRSAMAGTNCLERRQRICTSECFPRDGKAMMFFCHSILKKFCAQKSYETVNQCFHDSIISAFVGCKFNFKFNVNLTRTIPRGSLSFKTLSNSITHHGHNNLIATNFSMMEVEQFKTVLDILEAKLLFSELPTDANPIVPKPKVTLHHDNNSYLYGSWISDTVSQEMCLFSLNDHSDCRPSTQGSLVDSVYWRWEPTLTSKLDEDIISDVVNHLELSKNEFWTTDGISCDTDTTVTASHFVDSDYLGEDYSASFIDQIFSTENNRKIDNDDSMVVLQATNLTCDQATTTPSTNYSPDLFRKHPRSEVAQRNVSTPDSLPLMSLAKRGPDLFAEDSLSSPHLFGEANTPLSKMNNTTDFTSPALC